jgi:hypothetical protein
MITATHTRARQQAFNYEAIPCMSLSSYTITEMIHLAKAAGSSEQYLLSRICEYDTAIMNFGAGKLLSFQLIQQFTCNDSIYIYHGPVFSKRGGCLTMFAEYIGRLCISHINKNIFILAEIQNPAMLMTLHGIFGNYGYSPLSTKIPAEVYESVHIFCDRYKHIGHFIPEKFITTCERSLYKHANGYEELTSRLKLRGIEYSKGDSVLFSVLIPADPSNRIALTQQVHTGVAEVSDWSTFKKSFISFIRS